MKREPLMANTGTFLKFFFYFSEPTVRCWSVSMGIFHEETAPTPHWRAPPAARLAWERAVEFTQQI